MTRLCRNNCKLKSRDIIYDITQELNIPFKIASKIVKRYCDMAEAIVSSGENFRFGNIAILKKITRKGCTRKFFGKGEIKQGEKNTIKAVATKHFLKTINEK